MNELDQIAGFIELTAPGRVYIVWLFEDHSKHGNRLIDTPVEFCSHSGIGGEERAENLMRAKLEKWDKP